VNIADLTSLSVLSIFMFLLNKIFQYLNIYEISDHSLLDHSLDLFFIISVHMCAIFFQLIYTILFQELPIHLHSMTMIFHVFPRLSFPVVFHVIISSHWVWIADIKLILIQLLHYIFCPVNILCTKWCQCHNIK